VEQPANIENLSEIQNNANAVYQHTLKRRYSCQRPRRLTQPENAFGHGPDNSSSRRLWHDANGTWIMLMLRA
jgi:hypothetical protein